MKHTARRLMLLAITSLALTSCELFFHRGSSSVNSSGEETSSDSGLSSSSSSFESSSSSSSSSKEPELPEPGSLEPTKPNSTYMTMMDNNPSGKASTPSVNKAKLLVIPIWFESDSANYINEDKKEDLKRDIEIAYFGTNEETGWRSVKTYYEEESHDTLEITGTVSDWYNETRRVSQFASENNGSSMTRSLASTASNWYFTNNPSENRKDYAFRSPRST